MKSLKVLAICGSLRTASYNRMLLTIMKQLAQEAGAEVTELDLKKLDLPIYDQDIEDAGLPPTVMALKKAAEAADILLIVSPEYNHSIPGGLKNAIDWLSRGGNSLDNKTAIIAGVSSGVYGTVRMQPHLRQVLAHLNVILAPDPQITIGPATERFNADGSLKDDKTRTYIKTLIEKSLQLVREEK